MRACWMRWWLLAVLAGLAGFGAWRAWHTFHPRSSTLFGARERRSPALPRAAWRQFGELLTTAQRVAARHGQTIRSIQLVELADDANTAIYWTEEPLTNPGFGPLQRFERHSGGRPVELIGFYTRDGKPLAFTERTDPKNSQRHVLTVRLAEPVAPGQTGMIVRRERRLVSVSPGRGGVQVLSLDRLPAGETALHVRAVRLTADASLVNYQPKPAETVVTAGAPFVGWVSGPTSAAVTVTFRRDK